MDNATTAPSGLADWLMGRGQYFISTREAACVLGVDPGTVWTSLSRARNVPTGRVNVSTPETTVLDLVEAPSVGAGLSNVAMAWYRLLYRDLIADSGRD